MDYKLVFKLVDNRENCFELFLVIDNENSFKDVFIVNYD